MTNLFREIEARVTVAMKIVCVITANRFGVVGNITYFLNIKIPTLILHGEQDNLVDVRFNKHFLENIPNISLILYPKVGHMPPMEIPEIIAEDIKNFIVN